MKLRILLVTSALFFTGLTSAQFNMAERERELTILLDSLREAPADSAKAAWNSKFKSLLEKTLNEPTAFAYPFSQLKTVGTIDSPDNLLRIVGWNVEQDDQSQKYYAYVLKMDEKKGLHKVFELVDNSEMLAPRTEEVLDADNWYGALYYQIVPVQKSSKTYYTVLGWDGGSTLSTTKLIDVIYFTGNSLKLGAPLFKSADKVHKRVYFEHSEKSVMSLRWDADYGRIMFDHLSPETPNLEGFYEYYVPDMSYDAYEFKGNKWMLIEDVIGINKEKTVVHVSYMDRKTGEVEDEVIESKWIDPTSSGSPAGKEVHTAVTPEGTADKADKKSNKKGTPKTAQEVYDAKKKHKKEKKPADTYSEIGKKKKRRN